jgi:hypothetical protein
MTIRQRLVAVGMMAGIMYVCVLVAGFNGFDPMALAAVTGLFLTWHVVVHEAPIEPVPLMLAAVLHAVVAAALLGLGHLLGSWTGLRVDDTYPAAIAVIALILARLWRVRPHEAEALARSLEAMQRQVDEAEQSGRAPEPDEATDDGNDDATPPRRDPDNSRDTDADPRP